MTTRSRPPASRPALWPDGLLLAGFLSSGVSALGLELIWVRVLGLAFGSETFGMLGVVAAFFAGLALGAAAFHRVIVHSTRPIRIYIAVECAAGAYAWLGPAFLLRLTDGLPRVLGPLIGDNASIGALSLNLAISTVVLLPATVCMGTTTAAVVEAWRRRRTSRQNVNTVAWLYSVNTIGATLGILLSTYWALPVVGIRTACRLFAGFNLAAAALSWLWDRTASAHLESAARVDETDPATPSPADAADDRSRRRLAYGLLFVTGLAGIGVETVGTHVLGQILENTVHTFANILAVFLLGTAVGAWFFTTGPVGRLAATRDRCTSILLFALTVTGIGAAASLSHAGTLISMLEPSGASYRWHLIAQTAVIALVFLPITICMGAAFSHLVGYFTETGVGYASAVNTLGATLAPFAFGLVLIPSAGYGAAFYGAIAIYLGAFLAAHTWTRQPVGWSVAGACLALAAIAATYSPLVLVHFSPNTEVLEQRTGVYGIVSVTEVGTSTAAGGFRPRILQVDQNYQMGGSPGGVEQRMGHLAMLAARSPRQVLYLGVGTGITAGAALGYGVENVTGVDLLPEVLEVLPWFGEFNASLQEDPRVTLHASDARRFIRAGSERYDAIVADLYHPSRDGTASLYTREHFSAIASRLREGGVFVQWLPIYQMSPRDLKTIVRTFLDVFPNAHSLLASYSVRAAFGLVGYAPARGGGHDGLDLVRARSILHQTKGAGDLFEGVPDLLSAYMLDAAGLRSYAGPGPVNTDDNQRIAFDAASEARRADSADFYQTLASLLPYRRPFPDGFVRTDGADDLRALRQTVSSYGDAATAYLAAEILLRGTPGDSLPALAVEEYVKAYRSDVRFTSARRRLLELALGKPDRAKQIVELLWQAHPEQSDLGRLHDGLNSITDPDQVRRTVVRFLQTANR